MFSLKVSEQIKWQQSHPESIITYAFDHEAPFKHSVLIKPFMKEVFWFERPLKAYLYWNECLTGETSSSSLQRTLQGTTTIIVFLSHRKQVWHPLPQPPTPTFLPHPQNRIIVHYPMSHFIQWNFLHVFGVTSSFLHHQHDHVQF